MSIELSGLPPPNLTVDVPINFVSLRLLLGFLFEDFKEFLFNMSAKNPTGDFSKELFQYTGNRVHTKIVHIDQTARLQEMYQFFHRSLVPGCSKHVLSVGGFFVQFQD